MIRGGKVLLRDPVVLRLLTPLSHWGTWEGGWAPKGNMSFQLCARPAEHAGIYCWMHQVFCCLSALCSLIMWCVLLWLFDFWSFVYTLNWRICLRYCRALFISMLSGCVTDLAWGETVILLWYDVTFYFSCGILVLGCVFATGICYVILAGSAGCACFWCVVGTGWGCPCLAGE